MNSEEQAKYDKIVEEGYDRLVKNRPSKPMEAFIYYLWDQLDPQSGLREKDEHLKSFSHAFRSNQPASTVEAKPATSANKTN